MNKIELEDMRLHLMLSQSRLSTAEEVAQEVEDYWDQPRAGFIAPVVKALRKVENLMECHATLERVAKENAQLTRIPTRGW